METKPTPDTLSDAPFKPVSFLPRDIEHRLLPDGSILLQSRIALRRGRAHLPAYLRHHGSVRGDAVWIAARRSGLAGWQTLTFAAARTIVDELTQGLLDRLGGAGRPLAILSGNTMEHALLTLAAMQARIPVVPLSIAYARSGADFSRLRGLVDMCEPGLIFVESTADCIAALAALDRPDLLVVHASQPAGGAGSLSFADLRMPVTPAVDASVAAIDPDGMAKLMLTSGSTGTPKAVIHTQRGLVDAAESLLQTLGIDEGDPMVRLDWTPWSHVFGATSLALTLVAGGSFHIDDGRPTASAFGECLRNLRETAPTSYANVPAGFAMLIDALERDEALARRFFTDVDYLSYAAARLPDDVARRIQRLSIAIIGRRMPISSGYGATETTAAGAFVHWPTAQVGLIGLPQPGVRMKLVPLADERFEVRLAGAGITPGYYRQPDATRAAFDEDGWYRTGDAALFRDRSAPDEGLVFAGRIAEDFKLQTGTFVKVGSLRAAFLDAVAPLVQEVVFCGENEPFLGALLWLDPAGCRELLDGALLDHSALGANPLVRAAVRARIRCYNTGHAGSAEQVRRFALLDEPPSFSAGEVTDKGTINQSTVRRRRATLASHLFDATPPDWVLDV